MSMTVEEAVKHVTAYVYMEAENIPTMVARALDVLKDKAREAEQYSVIGPVERFRELEGRATPKSMKMMSGVYGCCSCGLSYAVRGKGYCINCGQNLIERSEGKG